MWITICALGVVIALTGENRSNLWLVTAGKMAAATAYIAMAWSLGAAGSGYGQVLLAGMAFCWVGDLLLISSKSRRLFLLGLTSFLLGHLVYICAFAVRGVTWMAVLSAGVLMAVFAWRVLDWLRPALNEQMRRPVLLYILAICAMMAMAVGTYGYDANWAIPLGALLFLLSDLAVARDRFTAPGIINRLWGLPTYFCAQMFLAASVMN